MTALAAALVNCCRTSVTTAPSPAISGTTLVIPKVVIPTATPENRELRPFPETWKATVIAAGEAANQENSEIVEVTAAVEEEVASKKVWKLTIVREAEGPMKARAILPGDIFQACISAAELNPGPWTNCSLGPKLRETGENAPINLPQIRTLPGGLLQMRGKIETKSEIELGGSNEIVKLTDTVIELPAGFVPGASQSEWNPRIPYVPKAFKAPTKNSAGESLGEQTIEGAMTSQLRIKPVGSLICVSTVSIPAGPKVDISFTGTFFGPAV